MSTKKNLIVPKLQKQNLGKVNPQKAEYLYISKEFCKEGLSQIIKDGGVQFKEIQKFVKDHQEPQYILVHASKLEEGYLAISLLAGIYNEIHSRGEWEEGAEPDRASVPVRNERVYEPGAAALCQGSLVRRGHAGCLRLPADSAPGYFP